MKINKETKELFLNFLESSDIKTIKELKNLASKNQNYKLSARLRELEKELITSENYSVNIDASFLIHEAYYLLMKKMNLSKNDIDNMPFYKFFEMYKQCK